MRFNLSVHTMTLKDYKKNGQPSNLKLKLASLKQHIFFIERLQYCPNNSVIILQQKAQQSRFLEPI